MLTQKKIIAAAEQLGWTCKISIEKKNKLNKDYYYKYFITFERYTDYGQDVYFDFTINKLQQLPDELYDTWQNYDPDEETALWIGQDGHGKNGAPYRLSDILKDMEEVDEALQDLTDEIYKIQ